MLSLSVKFVHIESWNWTNIQNSKERLKDKKNIGVSEICKYVGFLSKTIGGVRVRD